MHLLVPGIYSFFCFVFLQEVIFISKKTISTPAHGRSNAKQSRRVGEGKAHASGAGAQHVHDMLFVWASGKRCHSFFFFVEPCHNLSLGENAIEES